MFIIDKLPIDTARFIPMDLYPALSSSNDYIPVLSLQDSEKYSLGNKHILKYHLPVDLGSKYTKKFDSFCNSIVESIYIPHYRIWTHISMPDNDTIRYRGIVGTIIYHNGGTEEIELLMALCIKKSRLFSIDKLCPDLSAFSLLVSNSFIDNEEHFKIYRNVNKSVINKIGESIDVVYTNDIVNLCLNSSLKSPKYSSLSEIVAGSPEMNDILAKELLEMPEELIF